MWRKAVSFWDREDSLKIFLILLVFFLFVILPTSQLTDELEVLLDCCFGFVLIGGVIATSGKKKFALLAGLFVLLAICTTIAKIIYGTGSAAMLLSEICDIPAVGFFLYILSQQTLKDGPITIDRLRGAVATYLLIGMLAGKIYIVIALAVPGSFVGLDDGNPTFDLLYFSFTTLTTVGYGDISPKYEIARSVANVEALIGQLFPAIFIARLVTLEVETKRSKGK